MEACETQEEELAQEILPLISQEQNDGSVYLQLSRRLEGPECGRLRELSRQENSHAACLRSIVTLITGTPPALVYPAVSAGEPVLSLRLCYGNTMHRLVHYEAGRSHPQFGPVFHKLALQEQANCRELLEIIGRLSSE